MLALVRKKGGESYVNTQTAGAQTAPAVAMLPGGGYVVTWTDASQTGGDASGTSIKAQLYDGAGAKVGGEILVNSFTEGSQSQPAVTGLVAGGFVVTWTHGEDDVALGGDGSESSIKGQIFDANGADVGDEFRVNVGSSWIQKDSHVFALPGGGFAVSWSDLGVNNVFVRVYDSNGATSGDDILASNGRQGNQNAPAGVALASDRFVVLWSHQDITGNFDHGVYGQIFDYSGNRLSEELSLSTVTAGIQAAPDVAALAGGGFVAAWESGESDYAAKAQIFADNFARIGPELLVSSPGSWVSGISVTALPWGGFLVSWMNLSASVWSARGQLFDSEGNKVGVEFQINTEPVPFDSRLDVVTLASGEVAAVWTNEAGANAAQLGVKTQLLLLPTVGTPGDDVIDGTADDDAIAGLGGHDEISGGAGADLIEGNGGNDLIFGDGGNDAIDGSAGDDLLHGLEGDDSLVGGDGNDLLRGYSGVDHYDGGADDGVGSDGLYGDRVSFFDARATQGVVADLRTGIVSNDGYGNAETMANIESLAGDTAFADTFYGNDSINGLQGGRDDELYGLGGDDVIDLRGAAAVVDGGDGFDHLRLTILPYYVPDADADGIAEAGPTMSAGYVVDLGQGTLRDGFGMTGTVAGIEWVTGSPLADDLRGSAGDDALVGDDGNDFLRLQDGGADTAVGGAGNDVFLFGATLNAADLVDGSSGRDQIAIQGNYALNLGNGIFGVESIAILNGADTRFGDPGTNSYDYDLTTDDANVAAGVQMIVDASGLRVGEDFTFNGSAETNGSFFIYGGRGVDTLTGGTGNDAFYFGEGLQFGAGDVVNGGPGGIDQLGLRGSYTVVFGAGQMVGIESIGLVSAQDTRFGPLGASYNYNLTMNDGNVVAGGQLTLDAFALRAGETLTFNGAAETNGSYRIFGGQGNDTIVGGAGNDILAGNRGADGLTGGGGADTFRYNGTADSSPEARDHIHDFAPGVDKIDLTRIDADTYTAGDQAFHWVDAFTGSGAGSAGELRAYLDSGNWFIEGDTDGNGIADLRISMTEGLAPLGAGDFFL